MLRILLGILVLGFSPAAFTQPVELIPGGHISGGGEEREQDFSATYKDRFWNFLRSPAFAYEVIKSHQVDLGYLDSIVENLRITTVKELPGIRQGDEDRTMINYWEGEVPRIDVVTKSFNNISTESKKLKLFIHECLGLVRSENQSRLLDDNYEISRPLAEALLEFEAGHRNPVAIQAVKDRLMSCYISLYTPTPSQGDYWSYSIARASNRPSDKEPEYVMIPLASGSGAYFISPHSRYSTQVATFQWGLGALIFLPDEKSLRDDMPSTGTVLGYFPAEATQSGSTAHRYEITSGNIDQYLTDTVLPETLLGILKQDNPARYAEVDAAGELKQEGERLRDEFAKGNGGRNLEFYKVKALTDFVEEGHVLGDIEPALRRMRDIVALRILHGQEQVDETRVRLQNRIAALMQQGGDGETVGNIINQTQSIIANLQPRLDRAIDNCAQLSDPLITRAVREVKGLTKRGGVSVPLMTKPASSATSPAPTKEIPFNGKSLRNLFDGKMDLSKGNDPKLTQPESPKPMVAVYSPPVRKNEKVVYEYKIPKSETKHPDWDYSKALTVYIVRKTSTPSDIDDNGGGVKGDTHFSFLARPAGEGRFFKVDLNCSRNRGGGVRLNKSETEFRTDMKMRNDAGFPGGIGAIKGFWYDFAAKDECLKFAEVLNKNEDSISPENPVEFTIDNNAFYRIVGIKVYEAKK